MICGAIQRNHIARVDELPAADSALFEGLSTVGYNIKHYAINLQKHVSVRLQSMATEQKMATEQQMATEQKMTADQGQSSDAQEQQSMFSYISLHSSCSEHATMPILPSGATAGSER